MYLPRILFCLTIFSLFLSNGNALQEEENKNLRGEASASATTPSSSLWRRFLQGFGFGEAPGFAWPTSCETDCIAARSNGCYGVPTPKVCIERKADPNDIGVRSECYKAGFHFIPDKDTPKGNNLGLYRRMDLEDLADECYGYPFGECAGFSTTHYLKYEIPDEDDLMEYAVDSDSDEEDSDEDVICHGLYVIKK